jgi:hypothetical protein
MTCSVSMSLPLITAYEQLGVGQGGARTSALGWKTTTWGIQPWCKWAEQEQPARQVVGMKKRETRS